MKKRIVDVNHLESVKDEAIKRGNANFLRLETGTTKLKCTIVYPKQQHSE